MKICYRTRPFAYFLSVALASALLGASMLTLVLVARAGANNGAVKTVMEDGLRLLRGTAPGVASGNVASATRPGQAEGSILGAWSIRSVPTILCAQKSVCREAL